MFWKKLYENMSFNDEIRRIKKKGKEKMLVNIGCLRVLASEVNFFPSVLRYMSKKCKRITYAKLTVEFHEVWQS